MYSSNFRMQRRAEDKSNTHAALHVNHVKQDWSFSCVNRRCPANLKKSAFLMAVVNVDAVTRL